MALDGQLTLSVRIITPTKARSGWRLPTEAELITMVPADADDSSAHALIPAKIAEQATEAKRRGIRGGERIPLPTKPFWED